MNYRTARITDDTLQQLHDQLRALQDLVDSEMATRKWDRDRAIRRKANNLGYHVRIVTRAGAQKIELRNSELRGPNGYGGLFDNFAEVDAFLGNGPDVWHPQWMMRARQ
jgi:hypothetical protein